jgi:cell division cycle 20, cofactor of APC complex
MHEGQEANLYNNIAADESLKFWKVFEKKAGASAGVGSSGSSSKAPMTKQMTIR